MKLLLLFLALAGPLLTGCAGKDDASPAFVNPVPPNSASVTVDGVAFPLALDRTVAEVGAQDGALSITVNTAQVGGRFIALRLAEFGGRAEKIVFPAVPVSRVYYEETFANNGQGGFGAEMCSPQALAAEVLEYNQSSKTVTCVFTVSVCGGPSRSLRRVIAGQVNIPYRVR